MEERVEEPMVQEEELEEMEVDASAEPSGSSESNEYFPNWRPNRALRRFAKKGKGKSNFKKNDKKKAQSILRPTPIRIVIRPGEEISFSEELLALGAVRELKRQHTQLNLTYCTSNEEIYRLLQNRWFLSELYMVTSDEFFDEVVGDDIPLVYSVPETSVVEAAERKRYDEWFEKETDEKHRQQKAAIEKGIKDFKAQFPAHNFIPKWHKSNAFLWYLADEMGLPIDVPGEAVTPFGEIPSKLMESYRKKLHKSRLLDKPFVVFEFGETDNELVLASALDPLFPDCRMISRKEIDRATGGDVVGLLSALTHSNCCYVVGPNGVLTTAAWAAGIEAVMELYEGSNPTWDGCQSKHSFYMNWSQISDEEKPRNLTAYATYHIRGLDDE